MDAVRGPVLLLSACAGLDVPTSDELWWDFSERWCEAYDACLVRQGLDGVTCGADRTSPAPCEVDPAAVEACLAAFDDDPCATLDPAATPACEVVCRRPPT